MFHEACFAIGQLTKHLFDKATKLIFVTRKAHPQTFSPAFLSISEYNFSKKVGVLLPFEIDSL